MTSVEAAHTAARMATTAAKPATQSAIDNDDGSLAIVRPSFVAGGEAGR